MIARHRSPSAKSWAAMARTATIWAATIWAASLAACAPRAMAPGPPVEAARLEANEIVAPDGARLPLRAWLPEGEPRAVILGLHGMNDYSNAFDEPGQYWRARGIATYAYDQRGFGGTVSRGFWPGESALVEDLGVAVALVRARHPGKALYLVGESMGGGVGLAALGGASPPAIDGAILVAPAIWGRASMGLPERMALWLAARIAPSMILTGRGLKIAPSDNEEMLRRLARDPLVIKGARIDAIWGLVNLMDAALESAARLKTPALVLYGERDEIIPREATRILLERLPPDGKARVAIYPSGYHMLTRDLQANIVLDDIAAWIARRGAGEDAALPSGADARGRNALAPPAPHPVGRERS